jgi:hypothetical protein
MKKILYIFLFTCSILSAQDTIVFRSGKTQVSKVIEIGIREVKYYRLDNLQGPLYISEKEHIDQIIYSNGFSERFEATGHATDHLQKAAVPKNNFSHMGEKKAWSILKEKNNPQINNCLRKAKYCKISQPITFIGIPAAALGAGFLFSSIWAYPEKKVAEYQQTAGILFGVGAISLSSAIYLKSTRKVQTEKAIEIYNRTYNN